ncbi:MAG: DUF4340 domain-containing protein [Thermoanaerobaculia bacterium]|nr:DUF4340 domain-containing protein [Thermoanaerobaculia bacterium]
MSTKKLIILTGIFLALPSFVVFFERHQPTSEESAKARKKLLDFKADTLEKLTLDRGEQGKIELVKTDGRWSLTGSASGAADQSVVDSLVSDLNRLDIVGEVRKEFDPKEFGLDVPRATAELTFKDGSRKKVAFGKEVPGTSGTAAAEENRFGTVKFAPIASLTKPVEEFRSKNLFEVPTSEWSGFTIQKGPNKIVLRREKPEGKDASPASGAWFIDEPVKDLAARSFVEQLLADVGSTRVSEFPVLPPSELSRIGLQPASITLTAFKDGKKIGTASLGAAKADATGKLYAQRDGLLVIVDDRVLENLSKEFSAFRETKVLPLDSWTVTRFMIEMGDFRTGAEKIEGLWRSTGKRVPTGTVEDFLDRIARLEAKVFVGKKDYAAFGIPVPKKGATVLPLGSIEIRDEKSTQPRTLTFIPASPLQSEPAVAVEVSGRSDAMVLGKSEMTELLMLARKVKDAALAEPAPTPTREAKVSPPAEAPVTPAPTPR